MSDEQAMGDCVGMHHAEQEIAILTEECQTLRARLDEALVVLRRHEFKGYALEVGIGSGYCHECRCSERKGHAPDCRWDKVLKGEK